VDDLLCGCLAPEPHKKALAVVFVEQDEGPDSQKIADLLLDVYNK